MNSVFNTGDDSIDFSGGFPKDKRQKATGDAVIMNNYFKHGHGAVALGSGTTNGITNILVSDNVFQDSGVGIKN
uniref:CAZy families GH28 protein n=1 Tax=uncultured Dickeya sp. TaxID=741653 RepID=A0A060CAS0_9GAMM|nr:CAZy families GH28 protein [uncultured Dickeya sp.]